MNTLRTKETLRVDSRSNRPIDARWAGKLAREWDPDKVGVLTITEDGFIIDGQHRWVGAPAGYLFTVGIVAAVTPRDRAQYFLDTHATKAVSAIDKHRAGLTAGDPLDHMAHQVAEKCGVQIANTSANRTIRGVDAWKRIVKRYGYAGAASVLHLIQDAWPASPAAYSRNILTAVSRFQDYDNVDPLRVIDTLARNQPDAWELMNSSRSGHGYGQIHEAMVALYNRGLRGKKRLR